MNKWSELLLGLVLLIAAILVGYYSLNWGFWDFGRAAWTVFKGGLLWFVALLGLLFILLGISDLKN